MRRRKKRSEIDRAGVVEAIRRAGRKLGRAPAWGELRQITGVPESRVRVYFRSLAEAVSAAGLEPGRQGLRIETEELLRDFARVKEKLGRAPSRNEYLKEGKYSAGAFYARFGAWGKIAAELTTEDTEEHRGKKNSPQMNADGRRSIERSKPDQSDAEAPRKTEGGNGEQPHEGDKAIALRWATTVPALPGELAGKRRVTDAVCAMIVSTLLGAESDWQGQLGRYLGPGQESTQQSAIKRSTQQSALSIQPGNGMGDYEVRDARFVVDNRSSLSLLGKLNGEASSGGLLHRDRPVMGAPFADHALSNAPVNELGVVFLFGMLAGELGFQVDSLWGTYPDCEARRQIQPGKWQRVRIEIEYESVNFARHGHDPEKCDVIVCWKHNWKKCPKHIEVIELSSLLSKNA